MTFTMKIREERKDAALEAAIKILIHTSKGNISDEDIISTLITELDVTKEEAEEALLDYRNNAE